MKNQSKIYDVFLSFSAESTTAAVSMEAELASLGLTVFSTLKIAPGENFTQRIRDELGGCLAVVVLLDKRLQMPANVAIEVGGALAWKKPVYAIVENPSRVKPGALPSEVRILADADLEIIADEIQASTEAFANREQELLAKVYAEINVPTDRLPQSPTALRVLADRFDKETHTSTKWSSERLLRELLVMRKRGRLPRLRKGGTSMAASSLG